MKVRAQRATKVKDETFEEVFPFESQIHIITAGMDMDKFFDILYKQIRESVIAFLKNGSGWSIVNLERFDINIYMNTNHFPKFRDIKVRFRG